MKLNIRFQIPEDRDLVPEENPINKIVVEK